MNNEFPPRPQCWADISKNKTPEQKAYSREVSRLIDAGTYQNPPRGWGERMLENKQKVKEQHKPPVISEKKSELLDFDEIDRAIANK